MTQADADETDITVEGTISLGADSDLKNELTHTYAWLGACIDQHLQWRSNCAERDY
jgi:hypothetical protein